MALPLDSLPFPACPCTSEPRCSSVALFCPPSPLVLVPLGLAAPLWRFGWLGSPAGLQSHDWRRQPIGCPRPWLVAHWQLVLLCQVAHHWQPPFNKQPGQGIRVPEEAYGPNFGSGVTTSHLAPSAVVALLLGPPLPWCCAIADARLPRARGVKAAHWLSTPCGLLPSTMDDPLNGPLSARSLCLAHELVCCFTGTDGQLCEGIIWLCPWRVRCHWWRASVALASAAVSHAATTRWLGASSHLRAFAALPLMRTC